jgi:ABC-2 type transport system permease protein
MATSNVQTLARPGPMFAMQLRSELLRLVRNPAFSITSIVLPVMFYAFFGIPNARYELSGVSAGRYLLASFAAYAAVSVSLFSFGATVAVERSERMTVLMRATPLRPSVYLLGKVVASLAFALITLIVLYIFAAITAGVHMALAAWVSLTVRLVLGSLPFIALGFAIGYLASPAAAIAIINLTYLPLSFASGLFVPLAQLPTFLRHLAPYLPTYHYAQLAWGAIGAVSESPATSLLWLGGYAVLFLAVALRAYWREERAQFR